MFVPHQSVAGLPRLSRQEETSLANDVRRWRRLERVREEVSQQGAGGRGGGVGVEAWAMAAGMSVTVGNWVTVRNCSYMCTDGRLVFLEKVVDWCDNMCVRLTDRQRYMLLAF